MTFIRTLERVRAKFFPHKHPITPSPKLFMTLLVKDEADILERNLIFHKAMGVDGFVITNNNSSDSTGDIIKKYEDKGWIVKSFLERGSDYQQVAWVDRMIRALQEEFSPDWIINADADEFWYPQSGSLKNEISQTNANMIYCPLINMLPPKEGDYINSTYAVNGCITDPEKFGLARFNVYSPQIPKVIHRSAGYRLIAKGNHTADMEKRSKIQSSDIQIFHYCIRGEQHFFNKLVKGGEAVVRRLGLKKGESEHFVYYYEASKKVGFSLTDEYARHVGFFCVDQFVKDGVLVPRPDVYNFFKQKGL